MKGNGGKGGAAVIPRLARELCNELPEEKGYSERNIKRMLAFYRAYPGAPSICHDCGTIGGRCQSAAPVAERSAFQDSILWLVPWGHHALLMEKVSRLYARVWYMEQTLANGWSRAKSSIPDLGR